MPEHETTHRPERRPERGPVLAETIAGPSAPSSPVPPPPSEVEDARAGPRIGPKPRFRSFTAMLRAEPAATLQWLLRGSGGNADFFRGPVRWLFGRDLLVSLRSIAVYGAFGAELDHRDWMAPAPLDLRQTRCEEGAFWFDFVADTGDGQLAMYDMACLLLGDLFADDLQPGASVSLEAGRHRLPRGRFLWMGGDTAYHVADDATLEERVCSPFEWALAERGLGEWARKTETEPSDYLVFGIPGNHDYYDSLIGFNRLFRAPDNPRLPIADFRRMQPASFVALQLPYDYWLYGLDCQGAKLDRRQREWFRDLLARHGSKRLIVATPEPTTVFDAVKPEAARLFSQLGLPRPFTAAAGATGFERFPPGDAIHLDLSGDVHHYARYAEPDRPNYASVVAGGGGAFLHPTQTSHPVRGAAWPPPAASQYPERHRSRCEITRRLLCPWRIFRGGGVLVLGGLFATMLYFGAALGPGVHDLFTTRLGPALGDASTDAEIQRWKSDSPVVDSVGRMMGDSKRGRLEPSVSAAVRDEPDPQPERSSPLWSEWLALGLLFCVLGAGFATRRIFARASVLELAARPVVGASRYAFACGLALLALGSMGLMYWQRSVSPELALPSPWLASLLLAPYLAALPLSVVWVIGYLATLPKQAKVRRLWSADSVPRWTALAFGVGSSVLGLLAYGRNSVAAFASDMGALLAVSVLGVAPVVAAVLQGRGRPLRIRAAYALLGAWFGALQISVPLLLAVRGSWTSLLVCAAWALAIAGLALPIQRRWPSPWLLLGLWLVAGAGVLVLAARLGDVAAVSLARFALAFAAGGFFSCVWFGWYLAVSLGFGAHNNEAGGAARLDAFRHFIRFKIEPDRITGYVIGFDWPHPEVGLNPAARRQPHAPKLQVKVVDRFELTPQKSP